LVSIGTSLPIYPLQSTFGHYAVGELSVVDGAQIYRRVK